MGLLHSCKSEAMPQQAQAENHLPSLYDSPGASWQDKQAEGEAVPDVSIWYILYARFPKDYLNRPLGQPTHRPMGSRRAAPAAFGGTTTYKKQ